MGRSGFLAESYWPGVSERGLSEAAELARGVSAELRRRGSDLQFETSIMVPADETVFWLFSGDADDVRRVGEQIGVEFERILETLRIDGWDMVALNRRPDESPRF